MNLNRRRLISVLALALFVAACLCTGMGAPGLFSFPATPATATLPLLEPSATAQPAATAPSLPSNDTLEAIASTTVPYRDRYDLAARFLGKRGVATQVLLPALPKVGDMQTFHIENDDTQSVVDVSARLLYAGEHVAMWFEQGAKVDPDAIRKSGDAFDQHIYPTDRSYFGSEPLPGIDGDPRVHVLNTTQLGQGVGGYFYSPSLFPSAIVPYSNEKEIIYINLKSLTPGTSSYEHVLAHEFQHMIHYNVDRNEESWVNEGMSELAATLNGYGTSSFASAFLTTPETQLDDWPENGNTAPHYGAGYLFNVYFLDRFGKDAIRALVANTDNGLQAVDSTLKSLNAGVTADQFFGDWVIANLLNDPSVAQGHYAYKTISLPGTARVTGQFTHFPVSSDLQVSQYGTQYFELLGPARLAIHFQGKAQVGVIPASTFNTDGDPSTPDSYVWWSNRVDDSDTTLTREIDLSGVTQAQVDFDLWYWIEDRWDYGYVEASTDGGDSWVALRTGASTDANPHGNAYGPGYTGKSAEQPGANSDGWIHQIADLAPYAGKKILLRFEYITDDATLEPGMAVDNICIRVTSFCDNVENGPNGWDAQGFVRQDNVLPQRYLIQIVLPADDGTTSIQPFALDASNAGQMTISVGARPATLVISGLTRFTTEPAPYHLEISNQP